MSEYPIDNGLTAEETLAMERYGTTCKKSLQVQTVRDSLNFDDMITETTDQHRDVATALSLCSIPDTDEIVVYDKDGNVEYIITPAEVKILKQQMRQLLNEGGGE